jgi:hypothetical protein
MLDLDSATLILSDHGVSAIYKINLNGFWGFYHGTGVGAGSLQAFITTVSMKWMIFIWWSCM